MYPVLFRIGDFEVTTFGVMVAIGALVGLVVMRRELLRSGLPESAADAGVWGLFGGMAGAKLLWVFEHLGSAPAASLLFSRGGLSWYGGLIGGVGVGLFVIVRQRQPILSVLAAATPALAVGHLLGRIGCFLVGDDYGTPSDLPWAVAFPDGRPPTVVPVHPTQLYEAVALGCRVVPGAVHLDLDRLEACRSIAAAPMVGLDMDKLDPSEMLQTRGW